MTDRLYDVYLESTGVSTDTRKVSAGKLFFALTGDNFNGNIYAAKALELGAHHVVVDDREYYRDDGRFTLVEDSLTALQQLARQHRSRLSIPVIGLTGSNGKTTSKELLVAVLSSKYQVAATKGNFNNHIGVPLTVLSISTTDEIAVVEMGANHVGEIADLCTICQPTEGFITNIGKAHLEGFGGVEGIKQGKSELYRHLASSSGTIYFDGSDSVLRSLLPKGDYQVIDIKENPLEIVGEFPYVSLRYRGVDIGSKLTGTYNLNNIHYALGIGERYHVNLRSMVAAIEGYEPTNNRSQTLQVGTNTYLVDSYNANPTSMKLSIENLLHVDAASRVLIIGDMKEMGEYESAEHEAIIDFVSQYTWKAVYTVGEAFASCFNNKYHKFMSVEELITYIEEHPLTDSHILLKGSRSVQLERLLGDHKK